jgi:hypothetical protein
MLSTRRKKYFFKIGEVYFSADYNQEVKDVDIIAYLHSLEPREGCRKLYTLHLDLSKDKQSLFSELNKQTRRKINTVINRDQLDFVINYNPTDQELKEFAKFYNIFAASKGLEKCNLPKLKAIAQENGLIISAVRDREGRILCYHAYIGDGEVVRVLHSASHFRLSSDPAQRSLIGRANRYLHWMDINAFKDRGFRIYDFGGLALNNENPVLNNIDQFKLGFGGKIVTEYLLYQPKNFLSKLALKIFNYKQQRSNHGSKIHLPDR